MKFNVQDQIRAGKVKRWHILPVPTQNVAEHSYNVALLARHIAEHLGYSRDWVVRVVEYALFHDVSEVLTSDVPTPIKNAVGPQLIAMVKQVESCIWPDGHRMSERTVAIVKAADLLDAAGYIWPYVRDKDQLLDVIGKAFKDIKDRYVELVNTFEPDHRCFLIALFSKMTGKYSDGDTEVVGVWGWVNEELELNG